MKNYNGNNSSPETNTQPQSEKKKANMRPLALNNPSDSKLLPQSRIAELHRLVTTKPLTDCTTVEGELVERGCALISLLTLEGGASVAYPVKLIEQLKINPDEAQCGYIELSESLY